MNVEKTSESTYTKCETLKKYRDAIENSTEHVDLYDEIETYLYGAPRTLDELLEACEDAGIEIEE